MSESLPEARYKLVSALRSWGYSVTEETRYQVSARGAYGEFKLTFMPGNRRILISSHALVDADRRGKGWGKEYLAAREEAAKLAGVNLMLATVKDDNAPEVHILEKAGWKRLIARETGVTLWGKQL